MISVVLRVVLEAAEVVPSLELESAVVLLEEVVSVLEIEVYPLDEEEVTEDTMSLEVEVAAKSVITLVVADVVKLISWAIAELTVPFMDNEGSADSVMLTMV